MMVNITTSCTASQACKAAAIRDIVMEFMNSCEGVQAYQLGRDDCVLMGVGSIAASACYRARDNPPGIKSCCNKLRNAKTPIRHLFQTVVSWRRILPFLQP